jgi:hypothetical protein
VSSSIKKVLLDFAEKVPDWSREPRSLAEALGAFPVPINPKTGGFDVRPPDGRALGFGDIGHNPAYER